LQRIVSHNAMRTPQAAHLEMNAAYPEFKEGPLRLASIINGGILPHERSCRQINEKGVGERSVQAGYPEVESYTMSAGLTTPIDYGLGHAC